MHSAKFRPDANIPSLVGKVILVTGGNSGLGLETIRQLLKHDPARIFLTCRSENKFVQAVEDLKKSTGKNLDSISFLELNLASLESIKSAAKTFQESSTRLDILVNNAGIMMTPEGLTEEGYEIQFGTNHMGHAFLTHLLLPILERTSTVNSDTRVIFVASTGESMAPNNPYRFDRLKTTMPDIPNNARYGISKLANVHYAAALAKRHPSLKIISIHPGIVQTNLTSPVINNSLIMGPITRLVYSVIGVNAAQGALNQLWALSSSEAESGVFYHPIGVKGKGSKLSDNEEVRERLWNWTQQEIKHHIA